jgi:hypothetical protein
MLMSFDTVTRDVPRVALCRRSGPLLTFCSDNSDFHGVLSEKPELDFLSLCDWHHAMPTRQASRFIVLGHLIAEAIADDDPSVLSLAKKAEVLFRRFLFDRHYHFLSRSISFKAMTVARLSYIRLISQ